MTQNIFDREAAADTLTPTNLGKTESDNWKATFFKWFPAFLYSFITLVVVGVMAFATFRPIVVLPRIRLAPGFSFTNIQTGESVRNDELRGQITLYSFVFSDCLADENCLHNQAQHQALISQAAELNRNDLDGDAAPFNLITVLLDEELDPAWVAEQQTAAGWQLVHGDPLQTRYSVGQGFRSFYEENREEPFVAPKTVMVDGWGTIRAEYRTGFPNAEIFERDLLLLNEEIQNSTGLNRLGYEAAHLFVCYP